MPIEELVRIGRVRPIIRWGAPVLHRPTRAVDDFGAALQELLADMFATNAAAGGAGLAAPQIGVGLAAFIFDCLDAKGQRRTGVVCNPVVSVSAGPPVEMDEGCLSLPGAFFPTSRPGFAICRGQDQFGESIEVIGTGTLARCLQHETDHVRGRVFGDHLSSADRSELLARHDHVAHHYDPDWPVSPTRQRGHHDEPER